MKKNYIAFIAGLMISSASFAQNTVWPSPSSSDNVGIGTNNPNLGKLQINGPGDLLSFSAGGSSVQLNAYSNIDFRIIQRENAPLTLWTNTYERFRIDPVGNVGIGTNNPVVKLQVNSQNLGNGASTENWISGSFGGQSGNKVVIGNLYGTSTIGGHNEGLNAWSNLAINVDGGNVGIGTANPDAKLSVKGTIHTQEVKVDMNGWSDYVFKSTYKVPSLSAVEAYIDRNKHLPDVPSEEEVAKNGVNLGEMNKLLLKKVEELTLYLIEQNKQLENQQKQINELKKRSLKQ